MNNNDLGILVLSCDKYSDLWPSFFSQFKKHFPVGSLPIYLGSNQIKTIEPGVTTVLSGPDRDWSTSFKKILEQIPHQKVFVVLEDLFLAGPIKKDVWESALKVLTEKDALHIKYWAVPMKVAAGPAEYVGEIPRGAPFRATVCGIWDREYLLSLLIEGENPWNFEILGSYRTSYVDRFYALTEPLGDYWNMVEKGRWIPASVSAAQAAGVPVEIIKRPFPEGSNRLTGILKHLIFRTVIRIPWRWRVALMSRLRKALVSY